MLPVFRTFVFTIYINMEAFEAILQDLYDRIPRRHSAENILSINAILDDYADILGKVESINAWFEKNTAGFYPSLETIQQTIKMSGSNKHSKKAKDDLFDEASGSLKDEIKALMKLYAEGSK